MSRDSIYFLRINSNSEKKFLLKTGLIFDGLILRANYFESSSGFLSGLLLKLASSDSTFHYIIDPVTYVFSLEPSFMRSWQIIKLENADKKLRKDLHLAENSIIPSEWKQNIENPTPKQKGKIQILGVNRGYRKLADCYFEEDMSKFAGIKSILPEDFNNDSLGVFINSIINYQKKHILEKYRTDKFQEFENVVPEPSFILSPYFLIKDTSWFRFMIEIWLKFENVYLEKNRAIVILIEFSFLNDNFDAIIEVIKSLKSQNIFLWINNFFEDKSAIEELKVYTNFVITLSKVGKKIINLYPGGFSPFIIPFGLYGVIDNPGYGLSRDVSPVKGGIIGAKYYIPTLHIRENILEVVDLMEKNKVGLNRADFLNDVCNCPICQDAIKKDYIDMILYFNELTPSKKNPDKSFPTIRAIERCNFHFILSRLIEYRWAKNASKSDTIERLSRESRIWPYNSSHLTNWIEVLKSL